MHAASAKGAITDDPVVLRRRTKASLSRAEVKEETTNEKTAKLPIVYKKEVFTHAVVDSDLYEKLSQYRWVYDPARKAAYRDIEEEGKPVRRIHLHREIFGGAVGDGKTVKAHDNNLLNCVRSNLYEGPARKVPQLRTVANGKSFPRKPHNFVNYLKKNYKFELGEFVEIENIKEYGPKRITLSYEEGTDECKRAQHHSFREKLMSVLVDDFEFPGSLNIVKHIIPIPPPAPEKKPLPEPEPRQKPVPAKVESEIPEDQRGLIFDIISRVRSGRINAFTVSLPGLDDSSDIEIAISKKRPRGEVSAHA